MNFLPRFPTVRLLTLAAGIAILFGILAAAAQAVTYPSDSEKPELVSLLSGMNQLWQSEGTNNLHGSVKNAEVLDHNDEIAVWINNHATSAQQFKALQDANYTTYQVGSEGLGSELGEIYLHGLQSDELPLTNELLGNIINYLNTEEAKTHYSYPRPYLRSDTATEDTSCSTSSYNASSLRSIREGKSYADAHGNLEIERVGDELDETGKYVTAGTAIGAGYSSFCGSGSFPSGHTTGAYLGDLTLATLVPQLAPSMLARASEQANNRIVLGVHYPLDIIAGRMDGEVGVATRWSDTQYRQEVLQPAREELVSYLEEECGGTLAECIARQTPYEDDPYDGAEIPDGGSQTVTDEASAVSVYTERLTYGFPKPGTTGLAPSVPADAANLLITTFPTLTTAQRTEVLAQTEIESGYPLDQSEGEGSWQRLNLAAAMSAKVELEEDGSIRVASVGGTAEVVPVEEETTGGESVAEESATGSSSSTSDTQQTSSAGTSTGKTKTKTRTSLRISDAKGGKHPKVTIRVGASGATVAGTVRIYVGSKALKTVALRHGTVTFTLTGLSRGIHKVKAVYLGNGSFTSSTSASVRVKITGSR
ncbi:MAG: Ig-like domain repeat protein [Solirubrobacterales bacterium]